MVDKFIFVDSCSEVKVYRFKKQTLDDLNNLEQRRWNFVNKINEYTSKISNEIFNKVKNCQECTCNVFGRPVRIFFEKVNFYAIGEKERINWHYLKEEPDKHIHESIGLDYFKIQKLCRKYWRYVNIFNQAIEKAIEIYILDHNFLERNFTSTQLYIRFKINNRPYYYDSKRGCMFAFPEDINNKITYITIPPS